VGDILHYWGKGFYGHPVDNKIKIIFEEGQFNIAGQWGHSSEETFFSLYKSEIIGNIYENPELLEG